MGNKQEKNKKPKLDDKNITSGKIKDFNTNDSRNNSKRDILKNIKSKYIMIFIFSHLEEKRKLEIIKYNKNIQNILDIKLINYKFYAGKNLIYELNGNVKEYNELFDNIEFVGKYLNGKRNGKGKEYYFDGILEFEGEYLNGQRNGKGKEYDYDSHKIKFEGEYKNGFKWNGKGYNNNNIVYELKNGNGYVKEYYDNGILRFEVEYLNGNRHGKGKEYHYNGNLEFEGEYLNGKKHGKGKEYDYDGNLKFEGEYFYGKRWNGKGYDNNNKVVYELKNGKGYVKEYNSKNKIIFEGDLLNGEINGKGKEYDYDGNLKFEGEFLNYSKNGKGKEYNKDGNIEFEGEYLYNDKLKGKYYINGKLEYEGEYLYDKKYNGKGYDENGNIIYELNKGNGKVKEYDNYSKKLKFEGEYKNRKKNGFGKEFNCCGNLLFEGEYKNGLKWNGKGYDGENNIVYELNNGKGYVKEYNFNKLVFEGQYVNGQKNGKGKEYDWDKCIKFEGEYFNGIKVFK